MTTSPILGPALALVGITLVVLLWLYAKRIPAMTTARINPERLQRKDPEQVARMPINSHFPADNFINLFEAPILFYVMCFIVHLTGYNDTLIVNMAWAYVALRAVHSIIQCTYNKVIHRFSIYALSSIVLITMFVRLATAYMG